MGRGDAIRGDSVARAIEAAGDAPGVADLADDFLPLVEAALGASGTLLFEFGDGGEPRGLSGSLAPRIATYNATVFGEDPLQAALRRGHPRTPTIALEDVASYAEVRRSRAFREFYTPLGFERIVGVMPTEQRYGEPGMVGLIVGRPHARRAFSPSERRAFARVIPAMRGVIARDRRLRAREREREYVAAVMRGLATPTLVLDRRGAIAWRSQRAGDLLAAHPALARGLTDAVRRGRWGAVEIAGLHAELRRERLADGRTVAVAELREPRATADTVGATARAHGLTSAEASVLACVARGLDNRAIAAELGVRETTVKTHLRAALAKLGVATRTQAALRAHGLLPG